MKLCFWSSLARFFRWLRYRSDNLWANCARKAAAANLEEINRRAMEREYDGKF